MGWRSLQPNQQTLLHQPYPVLYAMGDDAGRQDSLFLQVSQAMLHLVTFAPILSHKMGPRQ